MVSKTIPSQQNASFQHQNHYNVEHIFKLAAKRKESHKQRSRATTRTQFILNLKPNFKQTSSFYNVYNESALLSVMARLSFIGLGLIVQQLVTPQCQTHCFHKKMQRDLCTNVSIRFWELPIRAERTEDWSP